MFLADATTLTGGTIASTAAAARNLLTTGSLSSTDIENRERFSASSLNLGGGIGDIGKTTRGDATTGTDRVPGVSLPGIGNVSANLPSAMSASGRQGSTTASSIAPGAIALTGDDPASRAVAAAISRDAPDAGALTRRFDEAERRDIEQGFAATRALTNEVGTFFANRAAEEAAAKDQVAAAQAAIDRGTDGNGNALGAVEIARLEAIVTDQTQRASDLNGAFGGGSAARLIATAVTGAAGSNVSGGLTSLVRGAAANVLQGLAVSEVKRIADSLTDKGGNATAGSEGVRAALQAVVGCAGAAAGGRDCGSGATGAAASVVANYLLTAFVDPKPEIDPATGRPTDRSLEDQEARKNLVTSLIAGIATGSGLDAAAAVVAAQVETERNDLVARKGVLENQRIACTAGEAFCASAVPFDQWGVQPEGSVDRQEFDEVRAVLGLDGTSEQITDILKAVYWGEVPYSDAVVYIQRGYSWEEAADRWEKNKELGVYGVFSPQHTDNWTTYEVGYGDNLGAIASLVSGSSYNDLLTLNPTIDPNALQAGQRLRIPTQAYIENREEAKLEFIRLSHYLESSGGVVPPGRAPAFAGEAQAVAELNAPYEAFADAWIEAKKRETSHAIATVRSSTISQGPTATFVDVNNVQKGSCEYDLLNTPPANATLNLSNGTVYKTNSAGLVDDVTFQPRLVKEPRDGRQTAVGKLGLDTDVGGHIQACSLGGTCDRVNLFPQDVNFNNGNYKAFEGVIRSALEAEAKGGPKVGAVSVSFERAPPTNPRPRSLRITYEIGGVKETINFKNKPGG